MSTFPNSSLTLGALDEFGAGTGLLIICLVVGGLILLGIFRWFLRWYVKVDQGQALIVNTMKSEPTVTFTGAVVIPVLYRAEIMDISLKTIEIDRRGLEGLICGDNIRADIKVTFFVRVNKTAEDVLKVAQSIGCERASKQETLEQLFQAKFSEALKTVGKQMDFVDLYQKRDGFKEAIIKTIGQDLNGYKLEDAAIDFLEQTPLASLSPDNILDAQGIKKITELTAIEKIKANEIRRNQEKVITQQDVDAREKILAMQRQQADAELRQKKEIDIIRAREEAEAKKTTAEEHSRAEQARIKSEEEIQIANENMQRQVLIAQKSKERVLAVENERVTRDQQLEVITRERATELQRIDKEKAVEIERKNIQEVIRERVAVEKTVAEEEERIKDTRAFMTADRAKKVAITEAEQEAQQALVKDIKSAEAQEIAAKHKSAEMLTIAQATLQRDTKLAEAKMKMAEGIAAEAAAEGLAHVRVKEADAGAIERVGVAEAKALRAKVEAEAHGIQQKGTAEAAAKESAATATEKYGVAEAVAIKEKMLAEAAGLTEKAEAMKALDEQTRSHEEYRLNLEKEKTIELAEIEARRHVGSEQAHVMGEAFKNAKIDIVGGDGQFFDRMVNAVGGGKALDGFVNNSKVAQTLGKEYLSGESSVIKDLKEVLLNTDVTSDDLKNLSVAALMTKLLANTTDETMKKKIQKLLTGVKELDLKGK